MNRIEIMAGESIDRAIMQAHCLAETMKEPYQFDFNGVTVQVESDTSVQYLLRDWHRAAAGYLGKNPTIGPHPKKVLSPEEIASDAAIEEENRKRREAFARANEVLTAKLKAALDNELSGAAEIDLVDADLWATAKANNQGAYGARTIQYAEDVARLVQKQLDEESTVTESIKMAKTMADFDGITGFMDHAATELLRKCWKHGGKIPAGT